MKTRLESAIEFAMEVCSGQRDKGDNPTILHALRVMEKVPYLIKIEAVLHDVVEDGAGIGWDEGVPFVIWRNDLRFELLAGEVKALEVLTKKRGEAYLDSYIRRVKEYRPAVIIKVADLEDHLHLSRIHDIPLSLIERYRVALKILTDRY